MGVTRAEPAPATPDGIWKILKQVAKRQEEADRLRRQSARQAREAERLLERVEQAFTSPWEQLVESLRRRDLAKLLRKRGMQVTAVGVRFRSSSDPERREVDVLATSEEEAVAVLVRSTLIAENVDDFLDLLVALPSLTQRLRGLRLYGAVAYLGGNHGAARYAAREGLFVIRAKEDRASIVNPSVFQPRDFHVPAG